MEQNKLYVQMFGRFAFTYADRSIVCNGTRSKVIWNILAYLISHRGKIVSTEDLISIVWKPEKNDNPTGAMRTAIHRARQMLTELTENEDCRFLVSKNGGYMWDPDVDVSIDVEEFDKLISSVRDDAECTKTCLAALDIYNGKFLSMQSAEMWVMPMQTYYHNLYESLIEKVIPSLERTGRNEEGVAICRKALQIDPYSEKIHQYLMRFLLVLDERSEVMKVYEDMSKLLLTTFGVMPDQESRALYREALQSGNNHRSVTPEELKEQLAEHGEIKGALICDIDFFKMLYHAQARAIVRNGMVIHTALLTLKSRKKDEVSQKSLTIAMDNFERHLSLSLRKGDVIARCSSSQFVVMLCSADYENSCKVCQRIIASFDKKYPHTPVYVDHFVQPLIPSTRS